MLLTHNGWIGGNGLNQLSGARRLASVGMTISPNAGIDIDWSNPQNAGMAINAELLYLTNLWRQGRGLPPVDPATNAPTVNVGMSPEVKNAMLLGGAVLLGAILLMGRKR